MQTSLMFLAVLGLAYSQPVAQQCFASPSSWSGDIFMVDYSEGVARRGYIFYNRTELRVHFFVETYEESRNFIRLWYFGLERMEYRLDESAGTCTRRAIPPDERFPTFGAPEEAVFRHQNRLGAENGVGLTVDYFRGDIDGGTYRGYLAPAGFGFREYECIPIVEWYERLDTSPQFQRNAHFTYLNITSTHINSLVWELPSECRQ